MTENEFCLCEDLAVMSPTPLVTFLHSSSPLSPEALSDPESAGIRFSLSPSTPSSGPVFTATTQHMRYEAEPLEDLHSPYYIAVRDKLSGNIRLVPTKIFQLSPQVAGKRGKVGEAEGTEGTSEREKKAEFTRAFGSSKAKRKLASAELAKNDPELLADTIGKTLRSVKEIEEVETPPSSLLLPPHHPQADQPAGIFLLEELLPQEVLDSAAGYAREARGAGPGDLERWGEEGRYGGYVCSWLSEGRLTQLKEHSRYHYKPLLKALFCLHFLTCFYLVPANRKRKSRPLLEEVDFFPAEMKEFCLSRFTELGAGGHEDYSLSRRVKDKLLLHLLALALVLEDYKMDAASLVSSLQIQPLSARKYFQAIGCKFVSNFPKKRKLANGGEIDISMKLFLVAPLQPPKKPFFRK